MATAGNRSLEGSRAAIFLVPAGTEETEFTESRDSVADAGASVDVVGIETGEAETVNNDLVPGGSYTVDRPFDEIDSDEYDALIVPGGTVGADTLRADEGAVDVLREHVEAGKPVGVICHGPWTLVEAGVIDGQRLRSYRSLETDVRNAGGEWVDEEVVVDDGLVTSRNPDDLEAFCEAIVETFADVE